jgi:hypothetical protein
LEFPIDTDAYGIALIGSAVKMGTHASPARKASASSKKTKSGGEGKKRKVFPESLGKEHLINLSNSIADSQSLKLQERVEKAKEKAQWEKDKRVEKMRNKAGLKEPYKRDSGYTNELKGKKQPMSKSSIRASLVAKQREKAKHRKEVRKAAANVKEGGLDATTVQGKEEADVARPSKKKVSFV